MNMTDGKSVAYRDRMIKLEETKREHAEDIKDLAREMKGCGLLAEEVAGIKLAVKRHFETAEKRVFRESAESFADALGAYRDSPLGMAAIQRHAA